VRGVFLGGSMNAICELKAKVTEQTHDDFLIAAKHLGFTSRSEFLRYLVERELYGISSQLQITRIPGAYTGQDSQKV
jgi:hypothetical protein